MKLWIVETTEARRVVIYAENGTAAVAGLSPFDRDKVRAVREWPPHAPFRVAFEPSTPVDADSAIGGLFWDGVTDWGEELPHTTTAALGDLNEAWRERTELRDRLAKEHEVAGHESGTVDSCPTCMDVLLSEAADRARRRQSSFHC